MAWSEKPCSVARSITGSGRCSAASTRRTRVARSAAESGRSRSSCPVASCAWIRSSAAERAKVGCPVKTMPKGVRSTAARNVSKDTVAPLSGSRARPSISARTIRALAAGPVSPMRPAMRPAPPRKAPATRRWMSCSTSDQDTSPASMRRLRRSARSWIGLLNGSASRPARNASSSARMSRSRTAWPTPPAPGNSTAPSGAGRVPASASTASSSARSCLPRSDPRDAPVSFSGASGTGGWVPADGAALATVISAPARRAPP